MQKDIILSTKGIGKNFYEPIKFRVLDDISFEAQRGSF